MRVHRTVGLWAMMVFVAACVDSPTEPPSLDGNVMFGVVGSNPVVGSVTGSGHGPCAPSPTKCLAPGPLRTFSFSAQVRADGSVSGIAQVKNRATGLRGKMNIECVNFFGENQNRAWIIGTVTQSNMEASPVGLRVGFGVSDNGEGQGVDVDQVTGVGPGPQFFIDFVCDPDEGADAQLDFFFDNVFGFDIGNGNVQVRAPEAG